MLMDLNQHLNSHPLIGDGRFCEQLVVVTPAFATQMPPPEGAVRVTVGVNQGIGVSMNENQSYE